MRVRKTTMLAIIGLVLWTILIIACKGNWKRPEMVQPNVHYNIAYTEPKYTNEEQALGIDYGGSVVEYEDDKSWVPELTEMELTYYTDRGLCADGVTTARKGVCAVKKDLIGMTAIVYSMNDELIGIYECCDTGFGRDKDGNGLGTIQEGKTIDIFFENDKDGRAFIKEYGNQVKVQFVYAQG